MTKKLKKILFCTYCESDIEDEETLEWHRDVCGWNKIIPRDQVKEVAKPTSQEDKIEESKKVLDFANTKIKKTHTEYAKEIMNEYHFVTMKDTQETLFYRNGVYHYGAESLIFEECENRIENCTSHMRREVFKTIQALTFKDRDQFDTYTKVLNVKNGLLNIQTGEFREHTPDFLSRIQLPINYDPNVGPVKFIKFMMECLPNQKERMNVYEEFASILLRDSIRLEKVYMYVGEGANGKSTFLNVIEFLIGKDNVSNVSIHDLIYGRFSRASLDGKSANIFADISNDELSKIGILKAIVSGDPINAEKKGKDPFKLKNYAKLFYSCNQLPEINEDSDAVFRRFIITEWNQQFKGEKDNKNLIYELTTEEELSGILNLLIHKSRIILSQQRLSYDQSTDQLRIEWKERADPVQLFANQNLLKKEGYVAKRSEVYSRYVEYCTKMKIIPKSMSEFTKKMKNLGFVDDSQKTRNNTLDPKGKTTRIWKSVTLVTPLRLSTPGKQIENKKNNTLAGNDERNHVTDVTKKQYICKDCNAGPFYEDEESKTSGNIIEFHKNAGHKVSEFKEETNHSR